MFDLAKIVSLSKRALHKYNNTITRYFAENVALNVWSDGGEWPQYQEKYDNMFSYIHKLVPKVINYVSCMTIASVHSHVQFCRQSSTVCAMCVPYNKTFKLAMLQHLIDTSQDRKITVIVRSSSVAHYIKTLFAEHDANLFLKGMRVESLAANVEILSPAMVLDNYLGNNKKKYGTLILYDADTLTVTYGLFGKLLPYMSDFPVYVTVAESDIHSQCTLIAQDAVQCPSDTISTLCVGHTRDCESFSPNIVLDIPLAITRRICDTHKRLVPVVTPNNRFTLLSRAATVEEKTRMAYWTLANGYHLVKKSSDVNAICDDDVVLYDRFDYYASLLWAIEVVTGVSPGNVIQARQVWNVVGIYSPILLDPISMHLSDRFYIDSLYYFKHGYNTKDMTWKLYYYTNVLYTTFTYEQSLAAHHRPLVTIRVGYVCKVDRSFVCRIMVQYSTDLLEHQCVAKTCYSALSQYKLLRVGTTYVGLDIRVGDEAFYKRSCAQFDNSFKVWQIICEILPAQRFIELQSIIALWNDVVLTSTRPRNWNNISNEFISNFVGSVK